MNRSFFLFLLLLASCTSGGSDPISGDGGASSSSGGSSSGNGGDAAIATPQAILTVNGGAAASCASVPPMTVGTFPDPVNNVPSRPIASGSTENGATVIVTCSVARNTSGGFDVSSSIIAGDTTFTLNATVDASGKTQTGALVLQRDGDPWASSSCTLSAETALMGVAPGRFWTMLSCPSTKSGESCDIFGQLRLENCTQE